MISKDKTCNDQWLEDAKKVLDYNPETGLFTWMKKCGRQSAGTIAGAIEENGYCYIRVNKRARLAHRAAFAWVYGRWPINQIDHINGNKCDNRICNLREASSQQNAANTPRRKDNTSGFKGVRPAKTEGKWWANIYVNGKIKYLGTYDSPELAHQAYLKAADIEFGSFAKGE